MTRKQLASRINSYEKGNRKWEWPLAVIYILGLVAIGVGFARPANESNSVAGLAMVFLFLWLAIPIPLIMKVNKKRMNKLELYCPSCDVSLAGEVGRLVVTTLYCSHCGVQILEDE